MGVDRRLPGGGAQGLAHPCSCREKLFTLGELGKESRANLTFLEFRMCVPVGAFWGQWYPLPPQPLLRLPDFPGETMGCRTPGCLVQPLCTPLLPLLQPGPVAGQASLTRGPSEVSLDSHLGPGWRVPLCAFGGRSRLGPGPEVGGSPGMGTVPAGPSPPVCQVGRGDEASGRKRCWFGSPARGGGHASWWFASSLPWFLPEEGSLQGRGPGEPARGWGLSCGALLPPPWVLPWRLASCSQERVARGRALGCD